jgi:hypothetical protein
VSLDKEIERIGKEQAIIFQNDNMAYMETLVKFDSLRHLMATIYHHFIAIKKIPEIESLEEEEKVDLKEFTREIAKGRLSPKEGVYLAKALFVLNYLL